MVQFCRGSLSSGHFYCLIGQLRNPIRYWVHPFLGAPGEQILQASPRLPVLARNPFALDFACQLSKDLAREAGRGE
jgi:hypothetical protein